MPDTDSKSATPAFTMPAVALIEDYEPPAREGFGSGRPKEPNPFEPVVEQLAATWNDETKRSRAAVELAYELGADDGASELRRIKAKFSRACGDKYSPGYEPRPNRHKGGRKYEGVVRVYLVPKIERKRKPANTDTATASA